MFRKIIFVFFTLSSTLFYTQNNSASIIEKLQVIDAIKNDSSALYELESISTEKLSLKLKLIIFQKIVARANSLTKFQKALSLANESIVLAQKNGLDSAEAVFNKLIGVTNYYMDRKRDAVPYFEKALAIASKNNFWELEASCYNNIGGAYCDVQEYKLAEPNLLKSIAVMNKHGLQNSPVILRTYRVLARLYSESSQEAKAEPLYLALIEKSKAINDTVLLCDNLLFYSEILSRRGQTEKACEMSGIAYKFSKSKDNYNTMQATLTIHSLNLTKAGKYKEAYELQKEASLLMRRTFAKDLEKEISEVEVKYKTEQIKQEKELAELKTKKQKQIYLLSTSTGLIIFFTVFLIWNQRKNAKQKLNLERQKLETLIEGEEKERFRIAKDLHDGIVQDLTAVKLKLNSSDNDKELGIEVDKAINEVRNMAYQMMPLALKQYGLIPALNDLLRKVLTPKNIKYELDAIDSSKENGQFDQTERLPEKIELCLYRVSQELVNNILKHSGATFVSFTLTIRQDKITLICEDNGKGFKEDQIQKGIGMNSLASRLEMLNGTITFQSPDNSGTVVLVTIPFSKIQ